MPLDAICIKALTAELQAELEGAKIEKVQQPARDMLLLSLHTPRGNKKLLLTAGTGNARVQLTELSYENPAEPPMFCMLLRKQLSGARILGVTQPEHERMIVLELETRNEMGDSVRKQLVAELMGRSANLLLVGGDGRIVDCLRRSGSAGEGQRSLLPGMIYRLPPKQEKTDFLASDSEQRRAMLRTAAPGQSVDQWLLRNFAGLSPLLCRELAFRCGERFDTLPEVLDALYDSVSAGELSPCMILQNGRAADFSFMPVKQYGSSVQIREFESLSQMLDCFYAGRDREERNRVRSQELTRLVKTARDRTARKLSSRREEYARAEDRESVRKNAELITVNLYRIKKGDRVLECEDYTAEGCPAVRIELDTLKTPQQNAAALYKQYNKLKAASEHLSVLIEQGQAQLDYLNSVLDELQRAESERDVSDIRRELEETGYLRQNKGRKPDKTKSAGPLRFVSDDGFEILAGRSNTQNDLLTTKTARRTDLWLHTQKIHGSHVILRCEGAAPTETALLQAACIAAYYSQGCTAGKIPVDYTLVKNVKKPSGALPGMVIYTEYETLLCAADEELVNRLKQ